MNIMFWLLILLLLVILWFCLSGIFKPIGNVILRIFTDTKDIVTNEILQQEEGDETQ